MPPRRQPSTRTCKYKTMGSQEPCLSGSCDTIGPMPASAQPDDRWQHWLVHLLWATSARTSLLGEAALGDSPLSFSGLGLLENVSAHPGIAIAEISRRAPHTQQTLSQLAARVGKLGFIERRVVGGGGGWFFGNEGGAGG